MSVWRVAVVALVLLAASPAQAAESVTGRWAHDSAACNGVGARAQSPLIVTDNALRWAEESCRIARIYKTGDTVHIQAQCSDAKGTRSVPVSLRPRGGRLQVRWNRAAAGELGRCP